MTQRAGHRLRRGWGRWLAIASVVSISGCAGHRPSTDAARHDDHASSTEVIALPEYADDARASLGVAELAVGVREHDRPAQVIPRATIVVLRSDGITERERLTDDRGLRVLDSLRAGDYRALVLRDGYVPLRVSLTAIAGCRMTLEAYLVADSSVVVRSRGRATITTCQPAPSRGFPETRAHVVP